MSAYWWARKTTADKVKTSKRVRNHKFGGLFACFAFVVICVVHIRVSIATEISVRLYGISWLFVQRELRIGAFVPIFRAETAEIWPFPVHYYRRFLYHVFRAKNRRFVPNCCTNQNPHECWIFKMFLCRKWLKPKCNRNLFSLSKIRTAWNKEKAFTVKTRAWPYTVSDRKPGGRGKWWFAVWY